MLSRLQMIGPQGVHDKTNKTLQRFREGADYQSNMQKSIAFIQMNNSFKT